MGNPDLNVNKVKDHKISDYADQAFNRSVHETREKGRIYETVIIQFRGWNVSGYSTCIYYTRDYSMVEDVKSLLCEKKKHQQGKFPKRFIFIQSGKILLVVEA